MTGSHAGRSASVGASRILTVCLGNICRSPTAEAALVEAAEEAGLALDVDSAGTGDWHLGHPPDPSMAAAAGAAGLQLRGTAQRVDPDLLTWADLVLVMDRKNLEDVRRMAADAGVETPVRLFREFDPERAPTRQGATSYAPDEVPDPYGGDTGGFEEVVRICRRTARDLIGRWDDLPDLLGRSGSEVTS
jgi:protein-tyrosine phosphatase